MPAGLTDSVRIDNPAMRAWTWAAPVLVSAPIAAALLRFPASGSGAPEHWGLFIAVVGYGMVIPLTFMALARRSRGSVEITAEEIRLTDAGDEVRIPWAEAGDARAHAGPRISGISFTGPRGRVFISAHASGFRRAVHRIRELYPHETRPGYEYRRRGWLSTLALLVPYCCLFLGLALSAWLSNDPWDVVAGFLAITALGVLLVAVVRSREPYHVKASPGTLELRTWLKRETVTPTRLDLVPVTTGRFTRLALRAGTTAENHVDIPAHRADPFQVLATVLRST